MLFLLRQVTLEGFNGRVRFAGVQEHRNDRQRASGVAMHEVRHHLRTLAVYPFLARMMKVKLDKLVRLTSYPQSASGIDIHLNAVSVVDEVQRGGPVVELQRWQTLLVNVLREDIDRRLALAKAARLVLRVQLCPM